MATLRITAPIREGLRLLADLPESAKRSLKQILTASPPTLGIGKLIEKVALEADRPKEEVRPIIMLLLSLYSARIERGATFEDFCRELFDALSHDRNREEWFTSEAEARLRPDLEVLLSLDDTLGVTARAAAIMVEHEHVWQSARILTDLRPVFGAIPTEPPKAIVVIHNLRIAYREGESTKEFFVALDSNDLRVLRAVLERAENKESSLESFISKTERPFMTVDSE